MTRLDSPSIAIFCRLRRGAIRAVFGLVCATVAFQDIGRADEPVSAAASPIFETDVAPLLAKHCLKCHGNDEREAGLDLRTVSGMIRGGDSGPAIVPGHADNSDLVDLIAAGKMPPEGPRVAESDVELLKRWINAGAPSQEKVTLPSPHDRITAADRRHWAFRRLSHPQVPMIANDEAARNPVDAFLVARLSEQGITYSQSADRPTLIRRLNLDLLGLPPEPEAVAAFVADERPNAWEHLVDRTLASPHFGERWGRHWLDATGYVDVYGTDNDAGIIKLLPGRWQYRDYVVQSLNDDKPWDRFLVEQLAGDELYDWRSAEAFTPDMREALVATGFLLSAADDTAEGELNRLDVRHRVLQLTGEIVASNLFGLTMECARCHNHKYEPISQQDYYRWLAGFAGAFNPQQWTTATGHGLADVPPSVKARIDEHNTRIDSQLAEIKKQQDAIRSRVSERLRVMKLQQLPEAIREDVKTALTLAEDNRSEVQKYLASKLGPGVAVAAEEIEKELSDEERREIAAGNARSGELSVSKQGYGTIQAVIEPQAPSPLFVLRRGEPEKPGLSAPPALPAILAERDEVLDGLPIAGSGDNFGASGAPPSHPDLLEWLSMRFVEEGWRVKPLIRLLVTSQAYQQASAADDSANFRRAAEVDPENHLLWRMPLRRLESETIRDCLLVAASRLNPRLGGEPLPLQNHADGKVTIQTDRLPSPSNAWRRSVYVLSRRTYQLSLLAMFDQPVVSTNCTRRNTSAVVTQSLTMLNDSFVREQARALSQRVAASAGDDRARQVDTAFRVLFCRRPSASECEACVEFLKDSSFEGLNEMCHMLMNTNEFLYAP